MTKVDLSSNKYEAFFQKLATDDDFRAAVENDPKAAFATYGIDLDPSVVFKTKIELPSKEELEAHLGEHIERLASIDAEMVFIR